MDAAIDERLTPCLELIQTEAKNKKFRIGIPSGIGEEDARIALTPQAVEALVVQGHTIVYEKSAGKNARFADEQYAKSGAQMVETHKEAFMCDIIVRLTLPTAEEIEFMPNGATMICCLKNIRRNAEAYSLLVKKRINIIGIDYLKQASDDETLLGSCLGEVKGQLAITTAAHLLESDGEESKGVIIGGATGVPPTEIIILGSDTTAFSVARVALAFGSVVKIFDSTHVRLKKLQDRLGCNNHVFTSIFHPQAFNKSLLSADVLIASESANGDIDYHVSKESLSHLKKNAVVIDLTPEYKSAIETNQNRSTIKQPAYNEDGHIYVKLPDISMLAAHTASIIISDIVAACINGLSKSGSISEATIVDDYICQGTAMLAGITTNKEVAEWYGVEYCDIRLLRF